MVVVVVVVVDVVVRCPHRPRRRAPSPLSATPLYTLVYLCHGARPYHRPLCRLRIYPLTRRRHYDWR